ncbi:6-bladed beta-propeller [Phocaeicola coprophilus]
MPMQKNPITPGRTKRSAAHGRLMRKFAACACALLPALMASCGSRGDENAQWIERCSVVADRLVADGDTMIVCDYSAVKESVRIPFSMWVDSLEVIKLDNSTEEALVGDTRLVDVSDNYIGINVAHFPYRLFTRQGKFVASIGSVGQGPGEYNILNGGCQIDEAHNRVYLLPWATEQILVYDFQGNSIGTIPLAYLIHKGRIHVDYDRQRVTVVQLSLTRNFYDGGNPSPPLWVQDLEGNIVHENRAPQLALSGGGYGPEVLYHEVTGNDAVFSIARTASDSDSLYVYRMNSNRLSPRFTTDFGSEIPHHAYVDFGDYYLTYIWGSNTDPATMHMFTGTVVKRLFVDKRTLRGAFYKLENDYLGGIALQKYNQWWGWLEYGYVVCMDPGDLLGLIEERLADPKIPTGNREFLNVWKSKISPDDNSYVILGKRKNRVD